MFCPSKEKYLAERKKLKARIKNFDKKPIPGGTVQSFACNQ